MLDLAHVDVEELGSSSIGVCPTVMGTCNGKSIVAMRDTGCTCIIVRSDLINPKQILEKTRNCRYIGEV